MKTSMFALALVAGTAVSTAANAAVVLTHYGFNDSSVTATAGSGTAINAVGTTSFFGGTTLGMPGSNSPPGSPSSQSGMNAIAIVGTGGGSMTFSLSTLNYSNIAFSFASQRTATGGATATAQYSLDGSNFINLGSITPGASSPGFAGASIITSDYFFTFGNAALANKANVFFRIVSAGASSASGNQRFDNLVVQGDLVPAPGAMALLGLGGIVAGRRRRN